MKLMLPMYFLVLANAYASQTYLLIGPSQSGKSSFINTLAKKEIAKSGSGDGKSTTGACSTYEVTIPGLSKVDIIDVPGTRDNQGLSDERIKEEIHKTLLSLDSKQIDGIILFEPVDRDTSSINLTLQMAKSLFGMEFDGQNAVFVFTMADRLPDIMDADEGLADFIDDPLKIIKQSQEHCFKHGFQTIVWQNDTPECQLTSSKREALEQDLSLLLTKLQPFKTARLLELQDRIHKRAQALYLAQPPLKEYQKKWVEQTIQEPVQNSGGWHTVDIPVHPQPAQFYVMPSNPRDWAAYKVFKCKDVATIEQEIREWNEVKKTQGLDGPKHIKTFNPAHVQVINSNTTFDLVCDHKWIYTPPHICYRSKKVKVEKQVECIVAHPLPIEKFVVQAKEEILQEIINIIRLISET